MILIWRKRISHVVRGGKVCREEERISLDQLLYTGKKWVNFQEYKGNFTPEAEAANFKLNIDWKQLLWFNLIMLIY